MSNHIVIANQLRSAFTRRILPSHGILSFTIAVHSTPRFSTGNDPCVHLLPAHTVPRRDSHKVALHAITFFSGSSASLWITVRRKKVSLTAALCKNRGHFVASPRIWALFLPENARLLSCEQKNADRMRSTVKRRESPLPCPIIASIKTAGRPRNKGKDRSQMQ